MNVLSVVRTEHWWTVLMPPAEMGVPGLPLMTTGDPGLTLRLMSTVPRCNRSLVAKRVLAGILIGLALLRCGPVTQGLVNYESCDLPCPTFSTGKYCGPCMNSNWSPGP